MGGSFIMEAIQEGRNMDRPLEQGMWWAVGSTLRGWCACGSILVVIFISFYVIMIIFINI